MMITQPLQRQDDGRWRMTERSDESSQPPYAIGYCVEDGGHETPEDASACFDRYEATERRRVYHEDGVQRRCERPLDEAGERHVCGQWTTQRVGVGPYRELALCHEHASVEDVIAVFAWHRDLFRGAS